MYGEFATGLSTGNVTLVAVAENLTHLVTFLFEEVWLSEKLGYPCVLSLSEEYLVPSLPASTVSVAWYTVTSTDAVVVA